MTSQPISITVLNKDMIEAAPDERQGRIWVYEKCVEAGMPILKDPITDRFWVKHGSLETFADHAVKGMRITWTPPVELPTSAKIGTLVKRFCKFIWEL